MRQTAGVEMVTPRTAKNWLAASKGNRGNAADSKRGLVDNDRVQKYVGIIRRGEWQVNNDAITFDSAGVLQNGHHRLTAVVESGIGIPILVLRGVDSSAYETMDQGQKRTLAQILKDHGELYATNLAALANAAFMYAQGHYGVGTRTHGWPTYHQAVQFIEQNPEIRESVQVATLTAGDLHCSPLALGLSHFLFTQLDAEEAEEFFAVLRSGEGLHPGDPIYELRERLLKDARGPKGMSNKEQIALTIKAWNFWRRGEQIRYLRFVAGGSRPEQFPEPV